MTKIYNILIAAGMLTAPTAYAFEITPEIAETGMKTLVVETIDGEEPTCESIEAPAGSWGVGITNVNKVPGSLVILDSEGNSLYESGIYEKKESGMTIKVRGNTSARFEKKPYKIKLEKKGDLLLRGDKSLNDKNWVLLSPNNNLLELGFLIGKWIEMPWSPEYEYVHLVLNDRYRGVYLLAEAVERNEKCRIVTDDTGFVTERDPYWWNEDGQYLPSVWNPQFNWTMKYPDFEDLSEDQTEYIKQMLGEFEDIISTEAYENLIDIDSFCRWLVAQDILGTSDGGGTNFYIAKNDNTPDSKLYIPVLWDVDSGMETEDEWSSVHKQQCILPLFENTNTALKSQYVNIYRQFSPAIYANLDDLAARLQSSEWEWFNKAAELNNALWGKEALHTGPHNASDLEWWFPARKLWLDNAVSELEVSLGIGSIINPDEDYRTVRVHTIDGIEIYSGLKEGFNPPAHGIYILSEGNSRRKVLY